MFKFGKQSVMPNTVKCTGDVEEASFPSAQACLILWGNVGELQGGGVTLKVGSLIFGDYVIVNEVADDSLVQNGLGALTKRREDRYGAEVILISYNNKSL